MRECQPLPLRIIYAGRLLCAKPGGSQAASVREAWRLALFGVLSPLGRLVEADLRAKLGGEVSLSWQELRASDLSGRARAFQSMVGAGMEVERAAGLAGLTGVA